MSELDASISFEGSGLARVEVRAGAYIESTGMFAIACSFLIALIALVQPGVLFKLFGIAFVVLGVMAWREVARVSGLADRTIEIHKGAGTLVRTVGGVSDSFDSRGFDRVELYEVNPPGQGNQHVFGLRLICKAGVVRLFGLHSEERVRSSGQALATWLEVPLVDLGRVSLFTLESSEPLL